MVQVAASCSTDEGCDSASAEELNCLLVGLQSFHPMVRDASMKVNCHYWSLVFLLSIHDCMLIIM